MHVLCPKFLAFKGPLRPDHPAKEDGEVAFPAGHYAKLFHAMGVRAVVRLNDADTYDPAAFTAAGIGHFDLQFPDCTVNTPPCGSKAALYPVPRVCDLGHVIRFVTVT